MVQDNLSKGGLRSAWTHRVPMPQSDNVSGRDTSFVDGTEQMLSPGDHSQHQHLQQLHHHHTTPQQPLHPLSMRTGGAVSPSPQGDADTPKKVAPALAFLQQQQQQLYSSRGRALFTSVDREILCNALACAGASMADPLMSMVDSYYAGKLGTTALAALGSNGALFSVLYFLCFTALAVLCTQAMASANSRGDSEGAGRGFIQAFAATMVVSTVLVCVLLSMPETLLGMFQNDSEVLALAKTYCMIRALSLPAALSINVSQAAFRSMLDLTTPFCIVMAVNAANYLLNELLMVVFPYGMAGCGWASVMSQYMGAVLFAAVIYRRRHKFGIPEALASAEDRFLEQRELLHTPGAASSGGNSTLVAKKASSRSRSQPAAAGSNSRPSQQKRHPQAGRPKRRSSQTSSREHSPRRGVSPRRSRESSGTLRIDVTAFEQQLARSNGVEAGVDLRSSSSPTRRRSNRFSTLGGPAAAEMFAGQADALISTSSGNIHHRNPSHQQQQQGWGSADPGSDHAQQIGQATGTLQGTHHTHALQQQQQHLQHLHSPGGASHIPSRLSTQAPAARTADALAAAASAGHFPGSSSSQGHGDIQGPGQGQQQQQQQLYASGGDDGGCFQLHRWNSVGSESKLPRYLVGGCSSSWGRLLLLLRSLDWVGFVRKFAGMTTRGMLILSTYTTANLVAAKGGTAMMAAHQVVQQQQQLQMSFAWSFLHVGQSMTANLFHSTSAVSGPKAARRLSERIVRWAMCSCIVLAFGTFTFRHTLPAIFTKDEQVQELVLSAALPAAVMLGLGWNNALEGCLLAADDQPFVVRVYPCAVAAALMQLARCYWAGMGLPGVWVALMTYYLVLLVGFAARYWVYRGKL